MSLHRSQLSEQWKRFWSSDRMYPEGSEPVRRSALAMSVIEGKGGSSVPVSYLDLTMHSEELADKLIDDPYVSKAAAISSLRDELPMDLAKAVEDTQFQLSVKDLKSHERRVSDLRATDIGKVIMVRGRIARLNKQKVKVSEACWRCSQCGTHFFESVPGLELPYPLECPKNQGGCGKPQGQAKFKHIKERSKWTNFQMIYLEEHYDGGQDQPQTLRCILSGDQVGVSQVDDIILAGVMNAVSSGHGREKSVQDFELDVWGTEYTQESISLTDPSKDELAEWKELTSRDDWFGHAIKFIAPQIKGHDAVKLSLFLWPFGGVSKPKDDGSNTRDWMNIILVGDPSTAKSDLLRFMTGVCPKVMYASGDAASERGLTVATLKDEADGTYFASPGVLPLCHRGCACIDELDKMKAHEISNLNTVLESGIAPVNRAGIVRTFKAETSVLAAANPERRRFVEGLSIPSQLPFPPDHLSRYDLIWVIRDIPDEDTDSAICDHVLDFHQGHQSNAERLIDTRTYKRMVHYARSHINPTITDQARKEIRKFWLAARTRLVQSDHNGQKNVAIAIRQLMGLVRLSEASARARLSDVVNIHDANRAIGLMRESLNGLCTDEFGHWNIDIVESGVTSSQQSRVTEIYQLIKHLQREDPKRIITASIIQLETDLTSDQVMETLSLMEKRGMIYEAPGGILRPIRG